MHAEQAKDFARLQEKNDYRVNLRNKRGNFKSNEYTLNYLRHSLILSLNDL